MEDILNSVYNLCLPLLKVSDLELKSQGVREDEYQSWY